jgi:hypothetical protein
MNSTLMCQYIEFVADRLLISLGSDKEYNVTHPFDFMDVISLQGKTNFFEKCVSDYSKANINPSRTPNNEEGSSHNLPCIIHGNCTILCGNQIPCHTTLSHRKAQRRPAISCYNNITRPDSEVEHVFAWFDGSNPYRTRT